MLQGHPTGLFLLFFVEMWERFSYYGMRAIFVLFLTKALLLSKGDASNVYGSFTGLVYLTPLIGGYVSDRYWGNRRSIIIGSILMALGQFLMFLSGSMLEDPNRAYNFMLFGLGTIILGNGFFKPNISTMLGQLYPKGDKRVDGAFTIFYMGINLGAFFSPLVCGGLGEKYNAAGVSIPTEFKWGFLAACIGMIVSLITFLVLKDKYVVDPEGKPVGLAPAPKPTPETSATGEPEKVHASNAPMVVFFGVVGLALIAVFRYYFIMDWIGSGIYAASISIPLLILFDTSLNKEERERIAVIFILAFFVIFFWSAFEQAGASLTMFAEQQTDRHIGSFEMPASWFQSINPLGIVLLAPLFSMFWGWLGKKNLEPSSPIKMAFGLLLLCLGYIVIMVGVKGITTAKISMWWLIVLYALHTMGELCLSPIGLSMVAKLAPARFASLLMGTWFLSNAAANKFAGTLSALIPPGAGEKVDAAAAIPTFLGVQITDLYTFFGVFVLLSGGAAILLFLLYRVLERMMHGVK